MLSTLRFGTLGVFRAIDIAGQITPFLMTKPIDYRFGFERVVSCSDYGARDTG